MNIEQTIRQYLPQVIHMSLATCQDNKPWVCEVHFCYDDELNLYFRSKAMRRHSVELETNAAVAGNIVTQHAIEQAVRGVYFEGQAVQLDQPADIQQAYAAYVARYGEDEGVLQDAMQEGGHLFYKISVDTYYLFDGYNQPSNKYELPWNKK